MKKQSSLPVKTWCHVAAWSISLVGGVPSKASAAVIAQTFERPLAPNTHNFGPNAVKNYLVGGKDYRLQWRIAPLAVDLDRNGTTDLTIVGKIGPTDTMHVSLTGRNETWALPNFNLQTFPLALPRGSQLGSSLTSNNPRAGWFNDADAILPGVLTAAAQGDPISGYFLPDIPFEQKYLGVRFERDGAMHYGWMGISGYANIGQEIYIHAWAYESQPDTSIIVGQIPEPGAGLLATASVLLVTLGRRRKQTCDK